MGHILSPEAEEIIDKELKVPSHGFVRLVDYMGSDQSIVQAARVSYGEGTKTVREDRGLIRYLMRHQHTTPFEMVVLKFHIKAPIFVVRQWARHRTACLSGDTLLHFDAPLKNSKRKHRRIHKTTMRDFHRMWHEGTTHASSPKNKPTFLERIEPDKVYTIPELSKLVERKEEDLRNYVRQGRLPAFRVEAGPKDPKIFVRGSDWHCYAQTTFTTTVPMRERLSKMQLRMCNEQTGDIERTQIVDIWENGEKDVYHVTLENGYSIKMTADHRCLTESGWMTLGQASGLRLSRRGNVSWNADAPAFAVNGALVPVRTRRNITKRPYSEEGLARIRAARSGSNSNFWKGGVTPERANIARWTKEQALFVHARYGYKCVICESKTRLHAHHVDPVWHNPSKARDFDNLMSVCGTCHRALHNRNLELDFLESVQSGTDLSTFFEGKGIKLWLQGKPRPKPTRLVRTFSKVARIEYAGRGMTYDLEVAGPYHNFVANGFIVHNSVNEESGRYSIMREEFHEPAWEDVGFQSKDNRQGRSSDEVPAEVIQRFLDFLKQDRETAYSHYQTFLEDNVARELSRIVLPLSLYSQFYWEMNLHNLFHFLHLRMDAHAQKEIRDYANQVALCVKAVAPIAWEAFEEYTLHGRSFSGTELDILRRLLAGEPMPADAFDGSKSLMREFEGKLGMTFPKPEAIVHTNGTK